MSAVSANTLFHFTDREALIGILRTSSFWPKYSLEHFEEILPADSYFRKAFIPHVCFCDLTITQLSNSRHTSDFGRFGIGLHKDWGIRNKVSPVVYVHKNSLTSNQIHKLINEISKIKKLYPEEEFPGKIRSQLLELLKYLKPYSGKYQKGKLLKEAIVYYNEREWRYCPSKEPKVFNVLSGLKRENAVAIKRINESFRNSNYLNFTQKDIKYLILDKRKDIDDFVRVINRMRLSPSDKNELKTKIITFTEIDSDF